MGPAAGNSVPPARSRAQALVETALVLPMIVFLLIGIVDLGRAYYFETLLARAVREGARVGSQSIDRTDAQITAAVTAAAAGIAPPSAFFCCTITPPQGSRGSGQSFSVMARYDYTLLTPGMQTLLAPLLIGGNLRLSQTAQMVVVA